LRAAQRIVVSESSRSGKQRHRLQKEKEIQQGGETARDASVLRNFVPAGLKQIDHAVLADQVHGAYDDQVVVFIIE